MPSDSGKIDSKKSNHNMWFLILPVLALSLAYFYSTWPPNLESQVYGTAAETETQERKWSMKGDCRVLDSPPNAEEFVQKGIPVIIRNGMTSDTWKFIRNNWNFDYLRENFKDVKVLVSMSNSTEFEYVEDVSLWKEGEKFWREWLRLKKSDPLPQEVFSKLPRDGEGFFHRPCSKMGPNCHRFTVDKLMVRPAKLTATLGEFLDLPQATNASYYIQYENIPLPLGQTLNVPSWANFLTHDMTGLWIGRGETRANLHYDPNENLMCMVSGSKEWTLYPPEESPYLYEGFCKEGRLEKTPHSDRSQTNRLFTPKLERSKSMIDEDDPDSISMSFFNSPVNILQPDYDRFPLLKKAVPKKCLIEEGEILYLPPFWWHQVDSTPKKEGRSIGINYWFSPYRSKPIPCPDCPLKVDRENFPTDPFQ